MSATYSQSVHHESLDSVKPTADRFEGRVGIIQRVLTPYRVSFFELLAQQCIDGLSVAAGEPLPQEGIATRTHIRGASFEPVSNVYLLAGALHACWQRGVIEWLEQWQPDILVVEANPRLLTTRLAVSWMKRRHRPVIGWGLGTSSAISLMSGIRTRFRTHLLRRFDGIIAYGTRAAAEYCAVGLPRERIFVAKNAVQSRPTEMPKRKQQPQQDQSCIIFVGRMIPEKRVELLLQACAQLPCGLRPRIALIGDGPERESLIQLAQDLRVHASFPGDLRGEALKEQWLAADLFVLPGAGGLAIQEAMSHGLPVIVATGDGTQDDLVSSKNGWLVPAGDVTALREAIANALSDRNRLVQLGAESLRIAREDVNLETMCEQFVRAMNHCRQALS